jgi:hypothetical protein
MVTLPTLALSGGYQIVLEAIDPTTGNVVAGSVVESIAIFASGGRAGQRGVLELPTYDESWLVGAPTGATSVLLGGG